MNNYLEILIEQQNQIIGQQHELLEVNRQLLDAVKMQCSTESVLPQPAEAEEDAAWSEDIDAAVDFLCRSKRQVQRYVAEGRVERRLRDGKSYFRHVDLERLHDEIWG